MAGDDDYDIYGDDDYATIEMDQVSCSFWRRVFNLARRTNC
jgi:hypothetical protein